MLQRSPMDHPINITLPPLETVYYGETGGPKVEGNVLIPRDFHWTGISAHYRVNGQYLSGTGGTFTVGEPTRLSLITYAWRLLDTKRNREFTNGWLSGNVLTPGDAGPFTFGAAESLLTERTLMRMFVMVQRMAVPTSQFGFQNVRGHDLQVVLHGYEEREVPDAQ